MPRILFFLMLFISCRSVHQDDSRLDIAGGRSTTAFPAVGKLDIDGGGGTCTGTLIAPRVVLTAAHCVTSVSFPPFKLNKSMDFQVGGKTYAGERWVLHPDYNSYILQCIQAAAVLSQKRYKALYDCEGGAMGDTCEKPCESCYRSKECQTCIKPVCQAKIDACAQDSDCMTVRSCEIKRRVDEMPNDIALVILKKSVSGIIPALLGRDAIPGESIELVGFGPRSLEQAETLGSKSRGTNRISEVFPESFTYLGSDLKHANLLGGDSGGPSFAVRANENRVLGVHSNTASSCDAKGQPVGVDIRVEAYLNWIAQETAGL